MIRILKKNNKFILGMILGLILASCGVYAATTIVGENITYSNTKSGLTSTNVQGAIDELYEKADIRKAGKFVAAYTYSESGESKCITGEESTCKKTTCYKTKTANSCPAGTIIKYKVNNTDILNFHVMFDNGSTMTMIGQRNHIYHIQWGILGDSSHFDLKNGPITSLESIEKIAKYWTNVNSQTYTLGTTALLGHYSTPTYTGCDNNLNCSQNSYTLPERTARARMITVQEAKDLGCSKSARSCPKWLYSNLDRTINDNGWCGTYWTLNSYSEATGDVFMLTCDGLIENYYGKDYVWYGVRPVIEIDK